MSLLSGKSLFQQLKELLSNDERTIWLLISMREEYFSRR